MRMVLLSSSARLRIRVISSRIPSGSIPRVGSSMMTTFGSFIRTSAIPRRCLIPRE